MADSKMCLGHQERASRSNIIAKLITKSVATPDENCRISIKKGPVSVETSLKELEEDYESKLEWKLIKDWRGECSASLWRSSGWKILQSQIVPVKLFSNRIEEEGASRWRATQLVKPSTI